MKWEHAKEAHFTYSTSWKTGGVIIVCGIFGLVNVESEAIIDEREFETALKTLRHRGPDGFSYKRFGKHAALGHTRLAIIDLSEENSQPLSVLERYWVVFNGEIFNYLELREELEKRGIKFKTSGDTEVLVYCYAIWGAACVSRFNGMWAFAIYDTQNRTLFCSRDRFGIKPFNYTIDAGQFLFASEIKAILTYRPDLAQPEYNAIANYCRTSVGAQNANTWFKDILRLPAGSNLTVSNGQIRTERYWGYPTEADQHIEFNTAIEKYLELFMDSVKLRMRSDVPLGIALSSGIDSSSIACVMQAIDPVPHHCFTSTFHGQKSFDTSSAIYRDKISIDESVSATELVSKLSLSPHVVDTHYDHITQRMTQIIYYLESGNNAPAIIPFMQLISEAKRYVKVVLDGQGADELLGGYILQCLWPATIDSAAKRGMKEALHMIREFRKTYKLTYATKMMLRHLSNRFPVLSRVHQHLSGIDKVFGSALKDCTHWKDYPELPEGEVKEHLQMLLLHQHSGNLISLLHYGDALSMGNGIETRTPFLDHRLVEFVWTLPFDYKVYRGIGKYLHRQAMRKIVPDRILDERMKYGFNMPISEQFKRHRSDIESPIDVLLDERCLRRGLFDRSGLQTLIEEHRVGRFDHSMVLFRLYSTELWFRQFIDAPPTAFERNIQF